MRSHFILYVADQAAATGFYSRVLACEPSLNVPGMTEFGLGDDGVLGLMPAAGIRRLLELPGPLAEPGTVKAELYLVVEDAAAFHARALAAGARDLGELELRDWGDEVAYCLDPDGHVLGFAQRSR